MEPGGVDEEPAADCRRLVTADRQLETIVPDMPAEHRRTKRDKRAGRFGLALIGVRGCR